LAFICYIVPSLEKHWKEWWSSLLKWCFFAPVFMFFFWLAVTNLKALESTLGTISKLNDTGSGFMTRFAANIVNSVGFFLFIGLMMGGIIAAQKLGITGANVAMGMAQKAKKGATDWAKRTSMRPVKTTGTVVGAGALTAGGKLFGDTKLGRRMRAKATEVRMKPEKYPQNVAYGKLVSAMPDEDAMKELMVKAITPEQRTRKLIAARNVAGRGLLRDATTPEAKEAMKTFKSFNDFEPYQKLKESRLDTIDNDTERNNTTQKVVQEGNLNKIPAIALKDERVVAAIGRFASAVQMESLRKTSPQHAKNLEYALGTLTTAGNAILAGMSALDQEKIHRSYASQTGDIGRMSDEVLRKFGQTAGADGIKRIEWKEELTEKMRIIAENIPDNQAGSTIAKINSGKVAKEMAQHLAKVKPDVVENDFILKGLVGKTNVIDLKEKKPIIEPPDRKGV
jgi:hypothetical protein